MFVLGDLGGGADIERYLVVLHPSVRKVRHQELVRELERATIGIVVDQREMNEEEGV